MAARELHWCPAGHEVLCRQIDISDACPAGHEVLCRQIGISDACPAVARKQDKPPEAESQQQGHAAPEVVIDPGKHVTVTGKGKLGKHASL